MWRSRAILVAVFLFILLTGCNGQEEPPPTASAPQPTVSATSTTEAPATPVPEPSSLLGEIAPTRTPLAVTPTPGVLARTTTQLVADASLTESAVLGIAIVDWITLGTFLLIVVVSYLLGSLLMRSLLPRLVARTHTTIDDEILAANGSDLRWLIFVIGLQVATQQVLLLSPQSWRLLKDIYFVVGLILVLRVLLRAINVVADWYRATITDRRREEQLSGVIVMIVRLGKIVVWGIILTVLLSHLGVNVTAFAATLGLGGLAISLAARDTVADAIAGMIILVDQPFRVGDRIEIKAVDTWGDVAEIGLRTTRIRTRDNRMVIVPNSKIGSNEVINYSFPDPNYRIQTHVGIAYDTDIEVARSIMVAAVQKVDGVLHAPDKPVDALYIEMHENAMIFRVRWWIGSFVDTRRMLDRVHTALQRELDAANIRVWPYVGFDVQLHMQREMAEQVSGAFWSQQEKRALPGADSK